MIETSTRPRRVEGTGRSRPRVDDGVLLQRIRRITNLHPTVGMAIGVVRDGGLELFHASGLAEIQSGAPITQDTAFRVGSITKTFTAIAILQLVERGLIDIDEPAARYLQAFRLVPAHRDFRPATIRHLLTHTAGIPEVRRAADVVAPLFGELVGPGEAVPPLADYYAGGLRIEAEPGRRYVYTDHDFTTLGQIVADVSGQPLADYMRENVFTPLGMVATDLERTEAIAARLATGYQFDRRGVKPVADYKLITQGGGGAYSTPRDLARYLAALIGGGANAYGRILKPETVATMFAPQYQPDPRIAGVGLAFTRFDLDGHPAVEHGGIVPGFISQVLAAPRDRVGVFGLTNGSRLGMVWLPSEMSRLLRLAIGVPDDAIRRDVAHHPEVWADLCGWYRLSARLTDVRARAISFAGVEVFVRRGRLMLRFLSPIPALYRGFELNPDDDMDPYAFRIDLSQFGLGTSRAVFSQSPGRGTTQVHGELMPLTLEKQPGHTNPRRWVNAGLAAVTIGGLAVFARRSARP